jgi:hypothetical protein
MNKKLIGYISVDAGLCWIGDPCYILHQEKLPKSLGKDWGEFCDKLAGKERSWEFDHDSGIDGLGVCVSSGHGDGYYPVYAEIDEHGVINKVSVEFI